jgi:hypothetical protein
VTVIQCSASAGCMFQWPAFLAPLGSLDCCRRTSCWKFVPLVYQQEQVRILWCSCVHDACRADKRAISDALRRLHVETSKDDPSLLAQMAYGMFDTRGKVRTG